MAKLKPDQVGRAGEYFVAAEITRRGGYAVTFSGNMPGIDVIATSADHTRKVTIQVKTKTTGDWQTSTTFGRRWKEDPCDDRYWVLVDIGPHGPNFYVMPAYWIENDIFVAHRAYLGQHDGKRAKNGESTHHRIPRQRVEQWHERWDVLGILPPAP